MADLVEQDFNGDAFYVGSSGEREELLENRIVALLPDMLLNRGTRLRAIPDDGQATARAQLQVFLRLNYYKLIDVYVPVQPENGGKQADEATSMRARKVAYIRYLTMREGMYDRTGTAAAHNVHYRDFEDLSWENIQALVRRVTGQDNIVVTNLATALANIPAIPRFNADSDWRRDVLPKHMDIVCTVAYFFRVRGHHWTAEMEEKYVSIWRKTRKDEDSPGLAWQYLAHDSLHAIFPDNLDEIWVNAAETQRCDGALAMRIDAAPAGVALISALDSGLQDLKLIVPKVMDYVPEAVQHLDECKAILAANRHAGSVNRRFYNAQNLLVKEQLLAPLASVIVAALNQFANQSPLLKSKALLRCANGAPISGGLIGKMIQTAAKSDAAAEIFLPDMPGARQIAN